MCFRVDSLNATLDGAENAEIRLFRENSLRSERTTPFFPLCVCVCARAPCFGLSPQPVEVWVGL